MNLVSVFEHEVLPVALSDAEKAALTRLQSSLGCELFKIGWSEVRATSFVGVVQLPKRTIQILPKMYRDTEAKEDQAARNLLFFLCYAWKLDVADTGISALSQQKTTLPEVVYWIFARKLWDAVRRDILRGYVVREDRVKVMKGRWLVAAQCRRTDGWRKDVFDVGFDEFTEDNLPNQLFKATVAALSRLARWRETQRLLTQLRDVLSEVSELIPEPEHFSRANEWLLAYRRRAGEGRVYRPLLNLAHMILIGTSPRLSAGTTESFAYTFDMNVLFEEFIAEFIRRELRNEYEQQAWQLCAQSSTRALLCDADGQPQFRLRPDLRFESPTGATELVLDTKWKLLDPGASKMGVAEADAYQMFAYAQRYACPRVVLLYPQTKTEITRHFGSDPDRSTWLEVRTVDMRRDFTKSSERDALRVSLANILSTGNQP